VSIGKYQIYSNARHGFSLKFRALICKVHRIRLYQTGSLWTGPCWANPRSSPPNHHVKTKREDN